MKVCHLSHKAKKITWFALSLLIAILIFSLEITRNQKWQPEDKVTITSFFILLGYGLLSLSLSGFLSNEKLKHPFPFRIAFFVTAFIGLLLILLNKIIGSNTLTWTQLLSINAAAFTGSFIASNLEMRWWENNAPPSSEVEQKVLKVHQDYMGSIIRSSFTKRLFDIAFALAALFLSLPIWLLVIILIWWEDPGPVLFVKNAVGRGGKNFKQLKFRSMVLHAEEDIGPIPITGYENNERVLLIGKFLRKSALDEVPQLINILIGDMSVVGPRPQRTVLVHGYLQENPEYSRRHRVLPGLAGLSQVVDSYDITPDTKLAWDLTYINQASFWLDLKLLFSAFYLVFALRWLRIPHPEYHIRKLLNIDKPDYSHSNKNAAETNKT